MSIDLLLSLLQFYLYITARCFYTRDEYNNNKQWLHMVAELRALAPGDQQNGRVGQLQAQISDHFNPRSIKTLRTFSLIIKFSYYRLRLLIIVCLIRTLHTFCYN